MNERTKLILLFQLPWVIFGLNTLFTAVLLVTHKSYIMGDPSTPFLTMWERNPDMVISDLLNSVQWVIFVFLVSIPFELMLLWHHKEDERNARFAAKHQPRKTET